MAQVCGVAVGEQDAEPCIGRTPDEHAGDLIAPVGAGVEHLDCLFLPVCELPLGLLRQVEAVPRSSLVRSERIRRLRRDESHLSRYARWARRPTEQATDITDTQAVHRGPAKNLLLLRELKSATFLQL